PRARRGLVAHRAEPELTGDLHGGGHATGEAGDDPRGHDDADALGWGGVGGLVVVLAAQADDDLAVDVGAAPAAGEHLVGVVPRSVAAGPGAAGALVGAQPVVDGGAGG